MASRPTTHKIDNLRDTDTGADVAAQKQLAGKADKKRRKLKKGVQQKM